MIYHCHFDLDYILNAPPDEAAKMLRNRSTGASLSSAEAKMHAAIMKAQGFEVMPICDHYDERGYCAGHEPADSATKRKS